MPSPIVIAVAIAVLNALLGVTGTLYYRDKTHELETQIATDAAKASEKVRSQKEVDAERTRVLEEASVAFKAQIQDSIKEAKSAFSKVSSTAVCGSSPAAAAFDASLGVRPAAPQQAPAGPPRPSRP